MNSKVDCEVWKNDLEKDWLTYYSTDWSFIIDMYNFTSVSLIYQNISVTILVCLFHQLTHRTSKVSKYSENNAVVLSVLFSTVLEGKKKTDSNTRRLLVLSGSRMSRAFFFFSCAFNVTFLNYLSYSWENSLHHPFIIDERRDHILLFDLFQWP